ncbi:hypothetical protein BHM03_00045684 [Ensete ventricosum]|nr:hypothetical protein BHM03_00045684 [Ensete ventricosum]
MVNPLCERYHEDKQAKKNVYRTKVEMAEFELWLDLTKVRGIANSENSILMQGLVYGRWSIRGHPKLQSVFPSTKRNCSENTEVLKQEVERGDEAMTSPEELNYLRAKHQSERRWTQMSAIVPQRRIYRSRRKGRRCKATNSRAMGLAVTWYCKCGTSMESSIPCSYGGRVLVIKGAEEVENTKTNFKY